MNTLRIRQWFQLSTLDARNIGRDDLLRWFIAVPLVLALAMRGMIPLILGQLGGVLPFDPSAYLPQILPVALVCLTPILVGMVSGFMLLDQRDDGVLAALRITPMGLGWYFSYVLLLPILLSMVLTPLSMAVAGFLPPTWYGTAAACLAAASLAPLSTLILVGFARNKIEGLALTKMSGVVLMAPFIQRWLLPSSVAPLGLVAFTLPTTWIAWTIWAAQAGTTVLPPLLMSLLTATVWGMLAWRRVWRMQS